MALSGSISGGGFSRDVRGHAPIIDRTVAGRGSEPVRARPKATALRMTMNRSKVSVVFIALVMFGSFMFVLMSYPGPIAELTPHPPFIIDDDTDFDTLDLPGSGAELDPYIISGYAISGDAYAGIDVSNTISHFEIRNVLINCAEGTLTSGVSLINVANGAVYSSRMEGMTYGIEVYSSNHIVLQDNVVAECRDPIRLIGNQYCDVIGNTLSGDGVGLVGMYLEDVTDSDIDSNSMTAFAYEGIYADSVQSSSISSNTISECDSYGVYALGCQDCVLYNNVLSNNEDSSWSLLAGGIVLDPGCSGNLVYHNSFFNNLPHNAYDGGTGNFWNEAYPTGGNYWSDHTGIDQYGGPNQDTGSADGIIDDPYPFEEEVQDCYPLMYPPGVDPVPEFTTVVVPVLVVMAMFLFMRRRRST